MPFAEKHSEIFCNCRQCVFCETVHNSSDFCY